ncbi:SRPBCC family protein [Cellulomonas marina]|uniref:Polyketide cyclase / dehydrase and lipid transport n=1 Tax=Cellulomonas marina TaxID=988821 RepID=A0A1I0ZIL4_9CELL|nr:SRPBCC family protein [Cellulomonas marina]GIG28620.1 hypothetical protein Cma02nite_12200 [Cellulomonas marina]SFB25495.1 hypothetical protein SAMN05421867_111109 [Cellulomonas marina]
MSGGRVAGGLRHGRLTLGARGPVPADVAWGRYDDPGLWAGWAPHIRRVEAPPRLAAGAGGRVHGPLGVRVRFVVTAVDRPRRRWAWRVHAGPLVLRLEHGVDAGMDVGVHAGVHGAGAGTGATTGAGSRTWLVLHGPLPVLLAYAPLAWWSLRRLVTLPRLRLPAGGAR